MRRLVTNEKKLLELALKPTFVSSKIFNENLVAVQKIEETLTFNRPAYVGMCILETLMIFIIIILNRIMVTKLNYYSLTQTVYLVKLKLKMCIKTFGKNKDKFDKSGCPENSPYFNKTNRKVTGKFKDEACN